MDVEVNELLILMEKLAKLGGRELLPPVSLLLIYRRLPAVVQGSIIKRCRLTALAFGAMGLLTTQLCPELQALGSSCGFGVGMILGAVVVRLWEPIHFHLGLREADSLEERKVITTKRAKKRRARLVNEHFAEDDPVHVEADPPPIRQQLAPPIQDKDNDGQLLPDGNKAPGRSGNN